MTSPLTDPEPLGALGAGLDPDQPIVGTEATILDFWVWAHSDVLSNGQRSALGEYLVALALGQTGRPRVQWDDVDVRLGPAGIEVKTTSEHQAWALGATSKASPPRFDIAPHLGDVSVQNGSLLPSRPARVYVFCFYTGPAGECTTNLERRVAVLDMSRWEFRVVPTSVLDRLGGQKSIGLPAVRRLSPEIGYDQLAAAVTGALGNP